MWPSGKVGVVLTSPSEIITLRNNYINFITLLLTGPHFFVGQGVLVDLYGNVSVIRADTE